MNSIALKLDTLIQIQEQLAEARNLGVFGVSGDNIHLGNKPFKELFSDSPITCNWYQGEMHVHATHRDVDFVTIFPRTSIDIHHTEVTSASTLAELLIPEELKDDNGQITEQASNG